MIQLTSLDSGTPIYVKPEQVAVVKTGSKLKAAEEVIIGEGEKNVQVFAAISLENGTAIAVRESPVEVVTIVNNALALGKELPKEDPMFA